MATNSLLVTLNVTPHSWFDRLRRLQRYGADVPDFLGSVAALVLRAVAKHDVVELAIGTEGVALILSVPLEDVPSSRLQQLRDAVYLQVEDYLHEQVCKGRRS